MHSSLRTPASAVLLVVCTWFGSLARAQEGTQQAPPPKPAQSGPRSTLIGPLSIGVRMGILVGDLMEGGSSVVTDTTRNPDRTTEANGESTSGRFGFGPVVQINLTKRISLNVDLMRRSVGYNATTTVTDEATSTTDAEFVSERTENITAKFWDLTLLPRYRFGEPGKRRPYINGGFALRSLSKERGTVQTTDADGDIDSEDLDVQSANSSIRGAAIGAGIQIQDDVGFKLELEFRYTRWFRRTFETVAANSNRNQAEVLLGLTF